MFYKNLYPDFVIVFNYPNKYKSFGVDKMLMKYINKKDLNYIIVYNDFTIKKVKRKINNYQKYLIKEYLYLNM